VMSEIIDGLVRKGLLARMRDARDRRRTLVWLTEQGRTLMAQERQVLASERLTDAFARLPAATRTALLAHLRALVAAGETRPSAFKSNPGNPARRSP
jgi:DNA-binding MarR family transcriptional regulator